MLASTSEGFILNLREKNQRYRQRHDEDMIEFGHPLKALLEIVCSCTGGEYEVSFQDLWPVQE
jgi:hypothetical protein